jgi:hypothetical protein
MRKVAFFGISGNNRYTYSGAMPECDGMPRSAGTSLENLLERYEATDNKGNMIHGEAPVRMFESDRTGSCYVSVQALDELGWSPERISEELSARFDLVVFSTANAIRPNLDPGCTAQVLDGLSIDFIVLGMGLQNPLQQSTEMLHQRLVDLLEICNRKAKIFGVRGLETESWLKSVGFTQAQAIGCPSMYVYPNNILGLTPPDPALISSAITGGYISARVPRASAIIELFKGFDAHYVMQEEMANWKIRELIDTAPNIYNDATGEVHKELVNSLLEEIHDEKMPFSSYRWFQDPNSWRAFASRFDFYLGDRLHGGVAALQAGVPAVMMAVDKRVIELVDFYKMPTVSLHEVETIPLREIVAERLSAARLDNFKEAYLERFRNFEAILKAADISLTVSIHSRKQQTPNQLQFFPTSKKRRAVRFIRRWLRKF